MQGSCEEHVELVGDGIFVHLVGDILVHIAIAFCFGPLLVRVSLTQHGNIEVFMLIGQVEHADRSERPGPATTRAEAKTKQRTYIPCRQ